MATENKKRLLTRWEIFFGIIVIIFLASFVLRSCGIDMMYKTEKSEIIEDPHPGY